MLILLAYYGFRGLALLALPIAFDSRYAALVGFAVVYGLDWVATVPPPRRSRPPRSRAKPAGLRLDLAAHQFGAATAAWAAGLVRTSTGEYTLAWAAAGGLAIAAALAVLLVATLRPRAEVPATALVARLA